MPDTGLSDDQIVEQSRPLVREIETIMGIPPNGLTLKSIEVVQDTLKNYRISFDCKSNRIVTPATYPEGVNSEISRTLNYSGEYKYDGSRVYGGTA